MATFTQIYYHIVFSTKNREPVLKKENRQLLFKYIWGILKNKKCHLYRINGVNDHLHILTSLHPSVALADLIKIIKTGTSDFIKEKNIFPKFSYWQEGYGSFTISHNDKERVIKYILNQEERHKKLSFRDEFKKLLEEAGVVYEDKYLL